MNFYIVIGKWNNNNLNNVKSEICKTKKMELKALYNQFKNKVLNVLKNLIKNYLFNIEKKYQITKIIKMKEYNKYNWKYIQIYTMEYVINELKLVITFIYKL